MIKIYNKYGHILHIILFLVWFSVMMIAFIHPNLSIIPVYIPLLGLFSLIIQISLIVIEEIS
jgi:hypothetical protein